MSLIEVSSPPGVSSSMTMASTPASLALSMLLVMNSAATGLMTPSTVMAMTLSPSAEKTVRDNIKRRPRRIIDIDILRTMPNYTT